MGVPGVLGVPEVPGSVDISIAPTPKRQNAMHYSQNLLLLLLLLSQPLLAQPITDHVIVLGVDGLSPSGIQRATTPHFNRVLREGAFSFQARAVLGTSSSQNWASMIMGAGPEQHGITSNGWERNKYSIEPTATGMEDIFPTIFGVLKEQRPSARTASIYDWGGFGRLYETSAVDVDANPEGPVKTMDEALALLEEEHPDFLFIHLDHVDGAGHTFGHGSDEYFTSVELADSLLGALLTGLEQNGQLDETLLIITSDHGGIETRHGGESMDELEIPWLAMGPRVKPGKQITDPVNTYDTASTAAFALGLEQPYAWVGRPVKSAFSGFEDGMEVDAPAPYVPLVRVHPYKGMIPPEGLTVTLSVDHDASVDIRYTTDESEPTRSSPKYDAPLKLNQASLIKAKAFGANGAESGLSVAEFMTEENGVAYRYFEGKWEAIPDLDNTPVAQTGEVSKFDLASVPKREDYYSIEYSADIAIETAGAYTFEMTSDDGSKLWVNGRLLIDQGGSGGSRTGTGEIELSAGRHRIVVAYFETYGDNHLDVRYQGPGIPKQPIPARRLFEPGR